jgi:phenylpyruvate tautomerase PptA (4-oxalocrotonate tautomerase family)
MPLIQCHVSKHLSPDARRVLIEDLADATTRVLGADPKTISVILHEHDSSSLRELDFLPVAAGALSGRADRA